ncbi:DUF3311 domain-containing protein [Paraburkholderia fungorum]|uniref:DUF3311 domain-containing protein n=1 Tax=Paraburkholderia fungorum TaxID=134537 RepID=A0A420GJW1_9BURK|nr:DUF3311 domain-containing protein [Paraburkholderia fungorum]RKF45416.1 hypothetical protein BCY88_27255 [Paraburkholderia fungorum]
MSHTAPKPGATRSHWYRWLLVIPFLWQAGLAPAVNDVALTPFGVPFPMFWQMTGIVVTSLVIGLVFRLDRLAGVEEEEAAFLVATSEPLGEQQ